MTNFHFLTTHVGSVPRKDPADLTHRLATSRHTFTGIILAMMM